MTISLGRSIKILRTKNKCGSNPQHTPIPLAHSMSMLRVSARRANPSFHGERAIPFYSNARLPFLLRSRVDCFLLRRAHTLSQRRSPALSFPSRADERAVASHGNAISLLHTPIGAIHLNRSRMAYGHLSKQEILPFRC